MEKFEINILGCGSALPTTRHNPSAQVINIREKLYMIDCGEGTQLQLRRSKLKFSRLNTIFISHLHGDHCFGLIGLISTFNLLGRTADLHIYAHPDLETILRPQLDYFCNGMTYNVITHPINPAVSEQIYEDRSMTVTTIPLRHRVPSCGFLIKEKPTPDHINRQQIDYYKIPTSQLNIIKNGAGYTTPDGQHIPHTQLTTPSDPPRSYAYMSDTSYLPERAPLINGVTLLYHEATFAQTDHQRAVQTRHSTTVQAARTALLADARQLIIGHYSARYLDENILLEEARKIFPNTILAQENTTIKI